MDAEREIDGKTALICRECYAEKTAERDLEFCPACGGALVVRPGPGLDPPGAPPRQVDRRGILLPPRHAVGGVITPR